MARRPSNHKKKNHKPKPELDPLQKLALKRLSAVDAIMSPFWSARSGHSVYSKN